VIDEVLCPKQLFTKLRLDWLDSYCFEDNSLQNKIQEEFKPILKSKESALALKWTGLYYKRQILGNYCPDLEAKWMGSEVGFGIFTPKTIPSHSFIGTYLGMVRRKSPFKQNHISAYSFTFPLQPKYWWNGRGWGWTIDAMKQGNHTRFINHSDQGNCEAVGAICQNQIYIIIRSKRQIAQGEQLLYNYGEDFWKNRFKKPASFS
jgi:hypothetical protein